MNNSDRDSRAYSTAYDLQHRNAIIFSSILLLLSLPGVQISPDGLLWLHDPNHSMQRILRIMIGVAAFYSAVNFTVEWYFQAFPHWKNTAEVLTDIRNRYERRVEPLNVLLHQANDLDAELKRSITKLISEIPSSFIFSHEKNAFEYKLESSISELISMNDPDPVLYPSILIDEGGDVIAFFEKIKEMRRKAIATNSAVKSLIEQHREEMRVYSINIETSIKNFDKIDVLIEKIKEIVSSIDPIRPDMKTEINVANLAIISKVFIFGLISVWGIYIAAIFINFYPCAVGFITRN